MPLPSPSHDPSLPNSTMPAVRAALLYLSTGASLSRKTLRKMAGALGFEPRSSVLETDSLTVELTPLWCVRSGHRAKSDGKYAPARAPLPGRLLLGFLMCRVLAAAVAELLELETAGGRLLVLRRRVVPLLAIRALQCDDFAHLSILPHRSQPASPSKTGFCRPLPLYFFPSTSGSP